MLKGFENGTSNKYVGGYTQAEMQFIHDCKIGSKILFGTCSCCYLCSFCASENFLHILLEAFECFRPVALRAKEVK